MFIEVENFIALQAAMERLCEFLQNRNVPKDNVFDSKLVVCELIGNVLKHSKGVATLESEVADGLIRIKISSSSMFIPPEKSVCSDVYAEHGRGLFLVDSVCESRVVTDDGDILVTIKIQ